MASNVTVELEGEPYKRTSIKTTPAMSLKTIRDNACEKLKLPLPDTFGLKYLKANSLDLSLSVRYANLPAGAKLVLIKQNSSTTPTASINPPGDSSNMVTDVPVSSSTVSSAPTNSRILEVNVAVCIDDGTRIIKKFPVTLTFWDILRSLELQDRYQCSYIVIFTFFNFQVNRLALFFFHNLKSTESN